MTNITVNDFRAFIQSVDEQLADEGVCYLNQGGCGFFAAQLAKRMIQIGMAGVGIRVYGGDLDETDLDRARDNMLNHSVDTGSIENWNDNGIDFAHIVVEWNGRYWDHEGELDGSNWHRWSMFDGYLPVEDCEAISATPDGWNFMYDRIHDDTVKRVLDECIRLLV